MVNTEKLSVIRKLIFAPIICIFWLDLSICKRIILGSIKKAKRSHFLTYSLQQVGYKMLLIWRILKPISEYDFVKFRIKCLVTYIILIILNSSTKLSVWNNWLVCICTDEFIFDVVNKNGFTIVYIQQFHTMLITVLKKRHDLERNVLWKINNMQIIFAPAHFLWRFRTGFLNNFLFPETSSWGSVYILLPLSSFIK